MVKSGTLFYHKGRKAKVMRKPFWSDILWLCYYEGTFESFYEFEEDIEKEMRLDGGNKSKMKLEYKFYEKNLAPKWLEGDYNLHIEGNRMVMTSKDGKKVEARCHPDDDWRLQVGIDELKERMAEVKKPREIKAGDIVKFVFTDFYNPNKLCDFFDTAEVATYDVMRTMSTALSGGIPNKTWRYEVLCVGDHLDSSINKNVRVALVRHEKTGFEFVVCLEKLELVE